jgi:hypothetical protein
MRCRSRVAEKLAAAKQRHHECLAKVRAAIPA